MAEKSELPMGVTKLLLALTGSEKREEQGSKEETSPKSSFNIYESIDKTPKFATL